MNKPIVAVVIAILAVSAIVLTVHSYLQMYKANQLKLEPNSSPTPEPTPSPILTPTPTLSQNEPVGTASAPKPSIPEFTIDIVDNSYDVPVTYTYEIDRFTGEERRISHGGYHVENKSIVFTIKNQPFTPYRTADGNITFLAYDVRVKGHYEEAWTNVDHINPSNGEYTTKSYTLGENSDIYMLRDASSGGEVDFQVQTLIGYSYEVDDVYSRLFYQYFSPEKHFVGEKSNWSNTQTIKIP